MIGVMWIATLYVLFIVGNDTQDGIEVRVDTWPDCGEENFCGSFK